MLVYKDLHWWTVLRIYQIFLVKLKIFLSKMQVNTKEILLNHPSKGLAQCALYCTVLYYTVLYCIVHGVAALGFAVVVPLHTGRVL